MISGIFTQRFSPHPTRLLKHAASSEQGGSIFFKPLSPTTGIFMRLPKRLFVGTPQ
jgi:hypothetical protein